MIQQLQKRVLRVVNDPFDVHEFLREKDLYLIQCLDIARCVAQP